MKSCKCLKLAVLMYTNNLYKMTSLELYQHPLSKAQLSLHKKVFLNNNMWMWWSGASEAHTPLVREDLGLILHPSPGWHFSEALISLHSDNGLKNY
jgi:hypothetical protein